MIIYEFKAYGKKQQYQAIDDAIRTAQFVRNKCLRLWMDNKGEKSLTKYDLNKYCRVLAKEFPFASELNSTARQAAAVGDSLRLGRIRAWSGIARFFDNCKKRCDPGEVSSPRERAPRKKVKGKKAENAVLGGSAVSAVRWAGSPTVTQLPNPKGLGVSPSGARSPLGGFPDLKRKLATWRFPSRAKFAREELRKRATAVVTPA